MDNLPPYSPEVDELKVKGSIGKGPEPASLTADMLSKYTLSGMSSPILNEEVGIPMVDIRAGKTVTGDGQGS